MEFPSQRKDAYFTINIREKELSSQASFLVTMISLKETNLND
jgi:hypothetical protein